MGPFESDVRKWTPWQIVRRWRKVLYYIYRERSGVQECEKAPATVAWLHWVLFPVRSMQILVNQELYGDWYNDPHWRMEAR